LKVFFDEDVPRKLVRFLPQHDIHTIVSMEWGGIKNGALLTLIERGGFHAFLTGDKNMENQQRLEGRPFAVLIMSAINWPVVGHMFIKSRPPSMPRAPAPSRPSNAAYSNRIRTPQAISACSDFPAAKLRHDFL